MSEPIPIPETQAIPEVLGSPFDIAKVGPEDVVRLYLTGKTENTVLAYRQGLRRFAGFVTGNPEDTIGAIKVFLTAEVGKAHAIVHAWRQHLLDEGRAPKTINHRISILSGIVDLANRLAPDLVPWRLYAKGLRLPDETVRETAGIGGDGVRAILRRAEELAVDPIGKRNACILWLLACGGLRIGEVLSLDLEHVNLTARTIKIKGKGQRKRKVIKLRKGTNHLAALRRWVKARGRKSGPLFVSWQGSTIRDGRRVALRKTDRRLSQRSADRMVKRIARAALGDAVGGGVRCHGFRHDAATEALTIFKGDIRKVQKFTRHKNADILLQIYDDVKDDAGEVAEALSDFYADAVKAG